MCLDVAPGVFVSQSAIRQYKCAHRVRGWESSSRCQVTAREPVICWAADNLYHDGFDMQLTLGKGTHSYAIPNSWELPRLREAIIG
jgi:hypothetical protein